MEASLIAVAVALGLSPLAMRVSNGRSRTIRFAAAALWLLLCGAAAWAMHGLRPPASSEAEVADRPIQLPDDGYVSSRACRSCHPGNHASWHASYHRTMTQVATPESVVADFDDVHLRDGELEVLLRRRGDEFWVVSPETGKPNRRLVMITGSHHMQIFWAPSGDSRKLTLFPFVYLIEEGRWITRRGAFLEPPEEEQIFDAGTWNQVCIKCHATRGQPRNEWRGTGMDTRAVEFGISCEACHGPGAEHVRLHRDPARRYRSRLDGERDSTIVDPRDLPPRLSSQVCGQCHSIFLFDDEDELNRWRQTGFPYRPGDELSRTRHVVRGHGDQDHPMLRAQLAREPHTFEDRYWSDGQVRVSGREYNGLIESPCYLHEKEDSQVLTCLSCHVLHRTADDPRPLEEWKDDQLGPAMDGDDACVQCHEKYRDLSARTKHSHHKPDSTGNLCYNCHMPYTTYGLLKAIRSHQIDSPSVAASLATGRPNACNQCHLDRSLGWTARYLEEQYEIEAPPLSAEERTLAASALWTLAGDAGQRALMAWSMGWSDARDASGRGWLAPYLAELLDDPYDAVRFIAYRSLQSLPGYEGFEYDFIGPPAERVAARRRALASWPGVPREVPVEVEGSRPDPASLLLDADGRLLVRDFDRLRARRDDRRVLLAE